MDLHTYIYFRSHTHIHIYPFQQDSRDELEAAEWAIHVGIHIGIYTYTYVWVSMDLHTHIHSLSHTHIHVYPFQQDSRDELGAAEWGSPASPDTLRILLSLGLPRPVCECAYVCGSCVCVCALKRGSPASQDTYGVALASSIDKITSLFCKRALQKSQYSAKEEVQLRKTVMGWLWLVGSIKL